MSSAENEDPITPCSQESEMSAVVGSPTMSAVLMSWKRKRLTDVLKLNEVTYSGDKAEQVRRIMSYFTHGVLPQCPACEKRVLKWTVRGSSARPYCPGYYTGGQKHFCSGPAESVQTTEWNWGAKKPHAESVSRARHQQTADEPPEAAVAAVAAAGTMVADAAGGRVVSDASKPAPPPKANHSSSVSQPGAGDVTFLSDRKSMWKEVVLHYRSDEKIRNQVEAALRLLAGAAQVQIKCTEICARPGGGILRKIFEQAISEQELDRLNAQQMLDVLHEFVQQSDEAGTRGVPPQQGSTSTGIPQLGHTFPSTAMSSDQPDAINRAADHKTVAINKRPVRQTSIASRESANVVLTFFEPVTESANLNLLEACRILGLEIPTYEKMQPGKRRRLPAKLPDKAEDDTYLPIKFRKDKGIEHEEHNRRKATRRRWKS